MMLYSTLTHPLRRLTKADSSLPLPQMVLGVTVLYCTLHIFYVSWGNMHPTDIPLLMVSARLVFD